MQWYAMEPVLMLVYILLVDIDFQSVNLII